MKLGLIWAEANAGAIGRDGVMPWHLPEDLAHFRDTTLGDPVIMGRNTWLSLPEKFRPLPGRMNIVVSRNADLQCDGAYVADSIEAALRVAEATQPVTAWVIGGGQFYAQALPFADELVVTRIHLDVPDADTFAPQIDHQWQLVDQGEPQIARNGLSYQFERWVRQHDTLEK